MLYAQQLQHWICGNLYVATEVTKIVAKQVCMLQVSVKRDIAAQVDHLAQCHCDVQLQVCCLHVLLSSGVSLLLATGHCACAKIVPVADSC